MRRLCRSLPNGNPHRNSIIESGIPEHSVTTTCAYCGVGCGFKAEMRGQEVIRMTPWKDGKANEGHACVKGRFAFGYATHKDRMTEPMIRDSIDEPWKKVSWDEALSFAASRLRGIQEKYGQKSIGAISSSRCTNEEVWLVQKWCERALAITTLIPVRASAFPNRIRFEANAWRVCWNSGFCLGR